MGSVGWGGGEAAIGLAAQAPAAFVDGAVVGPAEQSEVGQIGGATVEPVAQMVGLTPGQRPGTTGKDTATVADGQGRALSGLDDPAGPPDLQRLGRRTTQDRWQQGHRDLEPRPQPFRSIEIIGDWRWMGAGVVYDRPLIRAGIVGCRWCLGAGAVVVVGVGVAVVAGVGVATR